MRRISLSISFFVLFVLIFGLVIGASYSVLNNIYNAQLKEQGRNIAENVEAFGSWVASYGRVWVKDNDESFLGHLSLKSAEDQGSTVDFYSKNPALAQREFSDIVESLPVSAKFRMTSHNYMNPKNKPDEFESNAIELVRFNNLDEYDELTEDGLYRYAKTIYHEASCLSCHGNPENAPPDVTLQYGAKNGFGFKEGDVAGIISVRIPAKPLFESATIYFGAKELLMLVVSFIVPAVFVRSRVIKPIKNLTDASKSISVGKDVNLDVGKIRENTRNEVDQLTLATDRLKTTVYMAIKRIKRAKSNS